MPLLIAVASPGVLLGLTEAARTPLCKVSDQCDSKTSRSRQGCKVSSASVCLGLRVTVRRSKLLSHAGSQNRVASCCVKSQGLLLSSQNELIKAVASLIDNADTMSHERVQDMGTTCTLSCMQPGVLPHDDKWSAKSTLTTTSPLSSGDVRRLSPEVPLMAGLSSRPLPRGLPPGEVRGEELMFGVDMDASMSVKKGCRLALLTRGEVYSGMPLLLAGLECLQPQAHYIM